jgi:hypothetical protein
MMRWAKTSAIEQNIESSPVYILTYAQVVNVMLIYSNLCRETIWGDTNAPILMTIPIKPQQHGQYLSKSFDKIMHRPLSSNSFQYIHLMIRDEYGEPLFFSWGHIVITLHISKRKHIKDV